MCITLKRKFSKEEECTMNHAEKFWAIALPILADELTTASFAGFVEELAPVAIQGSQFILEAKDNFTRKTVTERYGADIESALRRATGKEYHLCLILPSEREQYTAPAAGCAISLNPKYTFDTFVIGSSNRFAHAASMAVANNPGKSYNPLFIYGGVGLGKTHLMHAIGNAISAANPKSHIMYVTSENFCNEMITAIRKNENEEFRAKYRNVDVLMVDDIQFISNKEGTQEEFFHTFNALYDTQKQIVISSDKQPKEIPTLEERLRSRFEWGLIADIQPPDLETRVAILENKAILESLDVSSEVLHFIASRVQSNIRELEGTLTRVMAYSDLTGQPVTKDLAAVALKDFLPGGAQERPVTTALIQEAVAEYYKITVADLTSKRRSREVTYPRQIAMYLARELTDCSLPKIGEAFGGRDHTTVMHAIDKISADLSGDLKLRGLLEDIKNRIQE